MKFLVVDDNQVNRSLLRHALVGFGYEVIEAENGQQAVEKFVEEKPSMVFMDAMMPVMNGFDACRQIKGLSFDKFVPVLFVTAHDSHEAMLSSVEAGGDDYIAKPINMSVLKAKIQIMQRILNLHEKNRVSQARLLEYKRAQTHQLNMVESVFSKILGRGDIQSNAITRYIRPVSQFNGDLLIYAYSPSGMLNIMLGDFTGHGLSAAIGALPVSDIFYDLTEKGFAISDIAVDINKKLVEILPVEMFCAAILVEINARENIITIWNGGMPDVLILDKNNKVIERCKSSKRALGVGAGNFDRSVEIYELPEASSVVLVSDGVVESPIEDHKHLGIDFVIDCIESTEPNQVSLHNLIHKVEERTATFPQKDDMSYAEILIGNIELEWQSLRANKLVDNTPSLDWEVQTKLTANKLKSINPVPLLLNMLMNFQGPTRHRERIFTVLAELFSNSYEHGVLKLDSSMKQSPEGFARYYTQREQASADLTDGWINFNILHKADDDTGGGSLTIRVEDSGDGFDYEGYEKVGMADITGFCGRGVALLNSLCDEVKYSGKGNQVTAVYTW